MLMVKTDWENLTFPAGTLISTERTVNFSDVTKSVVMWGSGQEQQGVLVYTAADPPIGTDDYTVIVSGGGKHQIKLNATKWVNSIAANVLGLLNIDTWQG
jgi:hypothetical protein